MKENEFINYGCGLSAPHEWTNYDVSPTLRIQRIPVLGQLMKSSLNTQFPENVKYGDIIQGLPVADNTSTAVYCSHTLEHLALNDLRKALRNTYKILKPGGYFRCVVPDLEQAAREYVSGLDQKNNTASFTFFDRTSLGIRDRPTGLKAFVSSFFGNSHHLWMWDGQSLMKELSDAGFKDIRICSFNDSEEKMFAKVEESGRFINAVALESRKW
jgi:SAM-dependent methyltransferase